MDHIFRITKRLLFPSTPVNSSLKLFLTQTLPIHSLTSPVDRCWVKRVGFAAGGTGITPMIPIIRWSLTKRLDAELFLVFANKTNTEESIILP